MSAGCIYSNIPDLIALRQFFAHIATLSPWKCDHFTRTGVGHPEGIEEMFDERKVAQTAAYFLHKRGDAMSHLKLMKLLYLADRESMQVYGTPISEDRMVSMPHGPVLSQTFDLMSGSTRSQSGGWEEWIADIQDHEVRLRKPVDPENLGRLSDADIDILDQVWERFGHMSRWEIRDYTHDYCPEWKDPNGSSVPLQPLEVFKALGHDPEQARELADELQQKRKIDQLFASL